MKTGMNRTKRVMTAQETIKILGRSYYFNSLGEKVSIQTELQTPSSTYGCGVFRNRVQDVAGYFAQVLFDEAFEKHFDHIVFAVLDHSARQENLRAFRERFL
ncbi:hypothetical protein [Brevibacillus centrosporus]|uniref:hypothetical protein n=1 Tax=Brevibacillus centrosporus TaxID=54910 RepID=UPI00381650BA